MSDSIQNYIIDSDPGNRIGFVIWLSFAWRMMIWLCIGVVGAIIASVILSLGIAALFFENIHEGKALAKDIGSALGFCASIWAAIKGLRGIIGKKFFGYRLLLIPVSKADVNPSGLPTNP